MGFIRELNILVQECQVDYIPEQLLFPSRITLSEYISDLMVLRGKSEDEYQELFDTFIQKLFMTEHMNKSVDHFSKWTTKKATFIQAVIFDLTRYRNILCNFVPLVSILPHSYTPANVIEAYSLRPIIHNVSLYQALYCLVVVSLGTLCFRHKEL